MIQNTKLKAVPMKGVNSFNIDIEVGGGQPSNTSIFHNGKLIHSQDHSFSYTLQVNKMDNVNIITTVSDLIQNPNRITVRHGLNPANVICSFDNAVQEGEIAINTTRFDFY